MVVESAPVDIDDGPLVGIAPDGIGRAIADLGPGRRLVLVGLDPHRLDPEEVLASARRSR